MGFPWFTSNAIAGEWPARFRKWFLREWPLLLVSIVVAVPLFLIWHKRLNHEKTLDVRVVAMARLPDNVAVSIRPSTVKVKFHGSRSDIESLAEGGAIEFRIPGKKLIRWHEKNPGRTMTFDLDGADIRDEWGDRIHARPSELGSVDVEFQMSTNLAFSLVDELPTRGSPVAGYSAKIDFFPRKVVLGGPAEKLKPLHDAGVRLRTEEIDLEGRAMDFKTDVEVLLPAELAEARIVTGKVVRADVRIYRQMVFGSISNIPVYVTQETGGDAAQWRPDPPVVTLNVKGPAAAIEDIRSYFGRQGHFGVTHVGPDGDFSRAQVWVPFHSTSVELISVDPEYVGLSRIEEAAAGDSGEEPAPSSGESPASQPASDASGGPALPLPADGPASGSGTPGPSSSPPPSSAPDARPAASAPPSEP